MDQVKIGKLIAECRKAKKLTQVELAEKLGVTDKSVSKWENGNCLPDVSLYKKICEILDITLNEFFAGEKLSDEKFKEVADNNLLSALENSVFTFKDKIDFYKRKWKKEHISKMILCFISWVVLIVALKFQNVEFYLIGTIAGMLAMLFYIILYNQMMIYVENNVYGKKTKISIEEFRNSMNSMRKFKKVMSQFKNKNEAIKYLVNETGLSKQECSEAYNFIMNLDLENI